MNFLATKWQVLGFILLSCLIGFPNLLFGQTIPVGGGPQEPDPPIPWKITTPASGAVLTIAGTTNTIDADGTWPATTKSKYIRLRFTLPNGTISKQVQLAGANASGPWNKSFSPPAAAPEGRWPPGAYILDIGEVLIVVTQNGDGTTTTTYSFEPEKTRSFTVN